MNYMNIDRNKKILFIFLTIFNLSFFLGQTLIDEDLNEIFLPPREHTHHYAEPLKTADNELQMLISAMFWFYKEFISSQDSPSCMFTPSCSVYSVEAFQKKGFIFGWLYTFDRLSRCHGLIKPGQYPFDPKTKRYYDPVR